VKTVPRLERAKHAWASQFAGLSQVEVDERVRGFATIVRAIAEHGMLSPERFAEAMGLDVSRAEELFAGLGAIGMQSDGTGNIVGAALTTQESPHKLRVGGKDLYAWCALDTLFIPGLLGEIADVESVCPTTGEPIRLRISPECVETCEPPDPWVSVFLPGGTSRQTGPASPT
jgi:alkylmercury lyase